MAVIESLPLRHYLCNLALARAPTTHSYQWRKPRFNSGGSVTLVTTGREGWQVGVFEHGYAPSGRLCTCDNDPRVGAQQVGIEQPNRQLMMPDERGLRRLDTRRGESALLKGNQPCIE